MDGVIAWFRRSSWFAKAVLVLAVLVIVVAIATGFGASDFGGS